MVIKPHNRHLQIALVSSSEATIGDFTGLCSRFQYALTNYAPDEPNLLANIQKLLPNIIFIDDEDASGPAINNILRSSSKLVEIPVVYFSRTASADQRKAAYQLSATDYLKIPFLPEEFVTKVERLLLYQSELELAKNNQRLLQQTMQQSTENHVQAMDMLAHDLKSPVSVMWSAVEILALEVPKADLDSLLNELNFLVAPMRDNLRRMREMIDTLLSNRKDASSQKRATSMRAFLTECYGELVLQARTKQIDYTWRGPDPDVEIFINVDDMHHVLQNLLVNALKYTPEGGRVELIGSLESETEVRIQVQDNGDGIAPQEMAMIFDRYYRAKQHRLGDQERYDSTGLGLGLAIAKSIVRKYDGKIWVESTVGRGSTFIVVLPALAAGS
jgi:signal transduction histidine kinase